MPNQLESPATPNTGRRALHAQVSDRAHELWHDFAATNGVSVSALLEVLGSAMAAESGTEASEPTDLTGLVGQARKVDATRRRRSTPKPTAAAHN